MIISPTLCIGLKLTMLDHQIRSQDLRKSINILIDRPNAELGRSSFAHRAAIAWNSLPDNLRHFFITIAFKNRLKKAKNDVVNINFGKGGGSVVYNKNSNFYYF